MANDEKRIVMKLCHEKQIRRINLVERPLSIAEVQRAVSQLFPTEKAVQLTYNDEDGDKITVSTDLELEEAYNVATESSNASIIRLNVETKEVDPQGPHPSGSLLCMSFVDISNRMQGEEDAQRKRKALEEAHLRRAEEAKRLEEELERQRHELEQMRIEEEEARLEAMRKAEEEAHLEAKRRAEEARLEAMRKAEEARLEAMRRAAEEEARLEAKRKAEEEASRRLEEELQRLRLEAEREDAIKKRLAEEAKRKADEEEAARREAQRKAEAEEALRIEKALEEAKKAFEAEKVRAKEEARKAAEAEKARKQAAEAEKARKAGEKKEKERQQYLATHPAREKGLLTLTSMGFEADACWEALVASRDNIEEALDKMM